MGKGGKKGWKGRVILGEENVLLQWMAGWALCTSTHLICYYDLWKCNLLLEAVTEELQGNSNLVRFKFYVPGTTYMYIEYECQYKCVVILYYNWAMNISQTTYYKEETTTSGSASVGAHAPVSLPIVSHDHLHSHWNSWLGTGNQAKLISVKNLSMWWTYVFHVKLDI